MLGSQSLLELPNMEGSIGLRQTEIPREVLGDRQEPADRHAGQDEEQAFLDPDRVEIVPGHDSEPRELLVPEILTTPLPEILATPA